MNETRTGCPQICEASVAVSECCRSVLFARTAASEETKREIRGVKESPGVTGTGSQGRGCKVGATPPHMLGQGKSKSTQNPKDYFIPMGGY